MHLIFYFSSLCLLPIDLHKMPLDVFINELNTHHGLDFQPKEIERIVQSLKDQWFSFAGELAVVDREVFGFLELPQPLSEAILAVFVQKPVEEEKMMEENSPQEPMPMDPPHSLAISERASLAAQDVTIKLNAMQFGKADLNKSYPPALMASAPPSQNASSSHVQQEFVKAAAAEQWKIAENFKRNGAPGGGTGVVKSKYVTPLPPLPGLLSSRKDADAAEEKDAAAESRKEARGMNEEKQENEEDFEDEDSDDSADEEIDGGGMPMEVDHDDEEQKNSLLQLKKAVEHICKDPESTKNEHLMKKLNDMLVAAMQVCLLLFFEKLSFVSLL